MDPEARFQALLTHFRESGHRMTPQRMAVLQLLASCNDHPTAIQIYERLHGQYPTMSLATVYKTLSLMKELGEVLELGFGADDNRYDGNEPYPHPHLICVRCQKIVDPDVPEFRALAKAVAESSGFQITRHRLDFFGICPECQQAQAEKKPES